MSEAFVRALQAPRAELVPTRSRWSRLEAQCQAAPCSRVSTRWRIGRPAFCIACDRIQGRGPGEGGDSRHRLSARRLAQQGFPRRTQPARSFRLERAAVNLLSEFSPYETGRSPG